MWCMVTGKEKVLAMMAHISYLFFGVGYVLVPLAIYLFFDGKDEFVASHAKQALKAQVIFGILGAVVFGLSLLVVGILLWPIIAVVGFIWFCCSIYACFKAINGERYNYILL